MEIDLAHPTLDFDAGTEVADARTAGAASADSSVPIAPLGRRRMAGLIDAALLLFAYGGFLTLFRVLGGRFTVSKLDAVVTVASLALLYAQYFTLFTFFGGTTPGMMLCKLRVASYDGSEPTPRQLLWRSFGYLVSAGTAMLGFVWALWDEEHLSWHDRISQTYLTLDTTSEDEPYADEEDPIVGTRRR